ncbi:Serine/threonine-protein kinase [Coemansia erecta]|uniref:non-specific serine/threonine protein kinase n=1 Tax=Coemansia erecta TaxID=147472 RepID=A0A9W7Y132_9FUNG|nr:Serine/threonine-protein kinase [Coemansia erecta]
MGQAASHSLVAAADLQPPLTMGVGGLETALGESPQHIRMLGSTRFMKTILCRLAGEGQLVLRVFMRPVSMAFDPAPQIAALRQLYKRLDGAQHVLAQTRVVSDERAVYVLRQYLHTSLYDRISTRPFLAAAEKRWVARQILEALRQAHGRGVCHGDIKAENVVVTSWNLAYLADFAPFKPTFLPADDPAEFNFYFDSAARQCCCVAPERFYEPGSSVAQRLQQQQQGQSEDDDDSAGGDSPSSLALRPAMDVFAAGCVIGELLLDGNPLFSLSRLLQYRRGAVAASALVASISDRPMAALVQHMIQLAPDARLSAAEYLDRWGSELPEAPRAAYMDRASADERVRALHSEIDTVTDATCAIAAGVACASVRNCRQPASRSLAIKALLRCSRGAMLGDVDLLLPCLVALTADASAQVRAEAVVAIRQLLLDVRRLAPINSGIFDDFLAPHVQFLAGDGSVAVRCAVAAVLGDWLDAAHALAAGLRTAGQFAAQAQAAVARLSFDESAEVKHVLLCSFVQLYGVRAQSLSHVITYLNDRESWFLRASFFDAVFAAALGISRHASREYIVPLVNLADHEAFVVVSALRALVRLLPQMSRAMRWDRLVEAQALVRARPELRGAAGEFVGFVLANAELPMDAGVAREALEMQADRAAAVALGLEGALALASPGRPAAPEERLVRLRDVGAALQTVFLTPVRDPWSPSASASVPASAGAAEGRFMRRKALELEISPAAASAGALRRQRLEGWRPKGTLAAEVCEHNDAVVQVVGTAGAGFVTGGEDGVLRLFDAAALRKNAVFRSRDVRALGGRIAGLAYHEALDCLVASADTGAIEVLRATRAHAFSPALASARLPAGEYAVCLGFARNPLLQSREGGRGGESVVAVTSRSRVLFFDIVDMHVQDAVQLDTRYGRPTALCCDGAAMAVVGTSTGTLVLVDTRFRIEVKTYRHFLAHAITCLAMQAGDSVLVGTAAGDVCALDLRLGKWPMCVCSRSLQQLKSNEVNRRLRVNALALANTTATATTVGSQKYFVSAGNDAMLRYWDLDHLDRSYVVNAVDPAVAAPYSSYRLNDTVYYCENAPPKVGRPPSSPRMSSRAAAVAAAAEAASEAAVAANSARSGGPITSLAIIASPMPMIIAGLQNGAIRVVI